MHLVETPRCAQRSWQVSSYLIEGICRIQLDKKIGVGRSRWQFMRFYIFTHVKYHYFLPDYARLGYNAGQLRYYLVVKELNQALEPRELPDL